MVRHSAAALTLCLFSLAAWTHALGPIPLSAVPEVVMSSDTPSRPSWETAAFFGPFLRLDGLSLPDAATSARVCRTAEALRLKVDCAEPRMDRVKSAVRARDADVWKDDCVEVFVQRPGQEYLHFVVNPAGAQFDERGRDASWDAKWRAEAERGEDRWSVQLEFSWAVFGGPPRDGETWGLNIARSRTPEHELSTWSPTGSGFHVPERFGKIVFSRAPYPTNVRWQLIGRRNGRVDVTWEPAAEATGLRLDVNGTATRRKFQIGTEGAVPLTLTAKRKGEVIFRALSVADVMPIQHALAAAHRRLEAVPAAVSAETDAARAALGGELGSLEQLGAAAPANVAAQVVKLADALSVRSSHLAVKAEMLRNKAKPDSIFYGVERSLTKLLRHEPFSGKPGGALHLDAARREMDAGQVVLFADNVPLLTVRAKMSAATGPKGKTLLATAFRVRRVGYIPTIKPVYAIEHVGLWPDPLLDVTAFDIREKSFESLWIDVRVPEDAAPGDYSGELTLTAANKRSTTVPVQVRVRDFTIPVRSSVCTAFGVNPGYRIKQDSDAYIRNALEHRITPYSVAGAPVLVSPPALDWHDARRIEFELTTDRAGTLSFYLTPAADRPPRRFEPVPVKAGLNPKISFELGQLQTPVRSWRVTVTGPMAATLTAILVRTSGTNVLIDAVPRRVALSQEGWLETWPTWSGSGWDTPDIPAEWDWSEYDAKMARYLPLGLTTHRAALRQPFAGWAREHQRHLSEKGWLDLGYTYLYDEPRSEDYPKVNAFLGEVKCGAPGVKNMMTARHFPSELKYVDVWCPEAYTFDPAAAQAEQAKGKTVWWYVAFSTRHPYPNVWVDYPALDCRVWPWMTWKHDLDGMLYWSVTAWSRNDPWRTAETFPRSNGDGSMLYPGHDGHPVDSIRWECLRDGMEDYEVLCLLEAGKNELGASAANAELVKTVEQLCAIDNGVVRSYKDYNPDPAALLNAREQMSDTLERIVATLGHEPVINSRPHYRKPVTPTPPSPGEGTAAGEETATGLVWSMPAPEAEPGLVLRYTFDDDLPFACDSSGSGMHGMIRLARRNAGKIGGGLRLERKGSVKLPTGLELLGSRPETGSIAVWVNPAFNPVALPGGPWEGYGIIFYLMETDGNGLPDGHDEIGLYVHGPRLYARCAGEQGAFASIPTPLRQGRWTHLCITWTGTSRILYVNGEKAAEKAGTYPLPNLDTCPGRLGVHPPHERWGWDGSLDEFRIYRRALTVAEVEALARP